MSLFGADGEDLPFRLPGAPGYGATWDGTRGGFLISVPGGELFYARRFFSREVSDWAVDFMQQNDGFDFKARHWRELGPRELGAVRFHNIMWTQEFIRLYGKSVPLPRLTAWYGDPHRVYTYSGITSRPNAWNDGLLRLKAQVEECASVRFNSVLLNWYRDGGDSLSWHADDEPELGRNPVVASANFGATRDFHLRRMECPSEKIALPLEHGTLLIMRGALQHHWQHAVPKRAGVSASRFNLTFRTIVDVR